MASKRLSSMHIIIMNMCYALGFVVSVAVIPAIPRSVFSSNSSHTGWSRSEGTPGAFRISAAGESINTAAMMMRSYNREQIS